MHTSQFHIPSGFLNLSAKLSSPDVVPAVVVVVLLLLEVEVMAGVEEAGRVEETSETGGRLRAGFTPVPGLAVSHATHLTTSGLFCTRQVSHSQLPAGGANKELRLAAGAFAGLLSNLDEKSVLGCGAWQATHFLSEGLFCTMQVPQFHDPAAGLNFSPKSGREVENNCAVVLLFLASCVAEDFWDEEENPGGKRNSS